ncbi:hypothetical protein DRQ36_05295 [bacterium]|nr:MAG: hypothetical protein DRQ36_05295 [bacterium]
MANEINYEEERSKSTDAIVNSTADKIVIVAGPGTGKTYTFIEFLKKRSGDNLALTFINNLANDLKSRLDGLAESHTFHSFCKSLLHKLDIDGLSRDFEVYPDLDRIIRSDACFIGKDYKAFINAFRTLEEHNGIIDFFIGRSNYYDTVSFDDYVYRVFSHFRENHDSLPSFDNIVIDEYQDFHRLEVEFIKLLASKSKVLIVGDDDQALYENIRKSSPDFIRELNEDSSYEKHQLPFCSRCPEVIVGAVNDVIKCSVRLGYFKNRIEKDYHCYLPDKKEDSERFPQIEDVYCTVQTKEKCPYIPKYIEAEILKIEERDFTEAKEEGYYPILVIGPSQYLKQVQYYFDSKEGFKINYKENIKANYLLDGYRFLIKDNDSNIGWRLVIEDDNCDNMNDLIQEITDDKRPLVEVLDQTYKDRHLRIINIIKKLFTGETLTEHDTTSLENAVELNVDEIKEYYAIEDEDGDDNCDEDLIKLKLTTFVGAKGLSAGFVFVIGFNNGDLPRDKNSIDDLEIKEFIVALSRTRKKCFLISNGRFGGKKTGGKSCFINAINPPRLNKIEVNKNWRPK